MSSDPSNRGPRDLDGRVPISSVEETNFRCPVCRARQVLAEECRRCKADLKLVYRARKRLEYLNQQLDTPSNLAEKRLLSPKAASPLNAKSDKTRRKLI